MGALFAALSFADGIPIAAAAAFGTFGGSVSLLIMSWATPSPQGGRTRGRGRSS
jgi:hypothetical protein